MMTSWWFLWMAFMFLFIVTPVGYGWGYRGWGPPYPRYIQRRRGSQAAANGTGAAFDHHAWGYGGDFLYLIVAIGCVWAMTSLWMR